MTLGRQATNGVPVETVRLAHKVFRKGNIYVTLRDALGAVYADEKYAALFSLRGQPSVPPGRLALVSVVQYIEGLSDRAAAEAVRARIDLKYLLGLALDDVGFDYSVLSEFRARLVQHDLVDQLLTDVLERCQGLGLVRAQGRQRTDSTHVLGAVRELNRYELVGESLRHALNALALVDGAWLQAHVPAAWYSRYGQRIEAYDLPAGEAERRAWAEQVGEDGRQLLAWLDAPAAPAYLLRIPAVQTLRQVWQQQYHLPPAPPSAPPGEARPAPLRWRQAGELPPAAEMIQTPYDPELRYSEKREVHWDGYKVHFSESCDAGLPSLITAVVTTPAPAPDCTTLETVHAQLAQRNLLPAQHLVDAGYTAAHNYLASRQAYGVDLVGPTAPDGSWQARSRSGFDQAAFHLDWAAQVATCPQGQRSLKWLPDARSGSLLVRFPKQACRSCPVRSQCTRAQTGPRSLRLRPQPEQAALAAARQRQTSDPFAATYRLRAGVEATHALALRTAGLRYSRFVGLAKTHFQHVVTAVALNLRRLADHFAQQTPRAPLLCPFQRLAPPAQLCNSC